MRQTVNLSRKQIITKDNLTSILNKARATSEYARFIFPNGIYINISYYRDNTIDIMTNSRDIALWNQIQILRRSYTQLRVVNFLFNWISKFNV